MKLREGTWKADFRKLVSHVAFPSGDRFGSLLSFQAEPAAYYNPYSFFIHSGRSDLWTTDERVEITVEDFVDYLRTGVARRSSDAGRLAFLLQETVWVHELRHFHDCVCTRSGIQDFVVMHGYFARILSALIELRLSGEVLRAPLAEMVAQGGSQGAPASHLLDLYGSLLLYRALLNGDVPPVDVPADFLDTDVVWLDFENGPEGLRLPTFPAGAMIDGKRRCLLVPLGFRALTETGATIIQRMLLRDVDQRFVDQYSALLRTQPVYVVVNLFLTRIAKRLGLQDAVERAGGEDLVYELVDRTLHNASGFGMDHGPLHPGAEMLRRMEASLNLEQGRFREETLLGSSDIGMDLDDPGLLASRNFLDVILAFTLRHCWKAACETYSESLVRLAAMREMCHRPVWYIGTATSLPSAPLSMQEGTIHYNGDEEMLRSFVPALLPWLFLLEVVEQIPTERTLRCPIAYDRYGGLGRSEILRPHSACRDARPGGPCGQAALGGSMAEHVDCLWRRCLRDWAIVKS